MPRDGVRKEVRCFTDEEMQRIIANAPLRTIVAITAVGLRIGETLALRTSDLDFAKKIIRIRQSVDAATRKVAGVKSRASSADLPMPRELEMRLRAYLERHHDGKHELLFVNQLVDRIPRTSYGQMSCIRC
jgi:integrase